MRINQRFWLITGSAAFAFLALAAGVAYVRSPALRRATRYVTYHFSPASAVLSASNLAVKLDVPFHRQEHALSCEVAALQMALEYYKVPVTESELIAALPFVTREPRGKNNVWGDPDLGFVGNIDGVSPKTGYGVYAKPIAALAQKYRTARNITGATLTELLQEVQAQRPVVVWGTLSSGRDTSWMTPEGKKVKAVVGEHARVVVGFFGTLEEPTRILLQDPIYGTITMTRQKFIQNWGLLGNMAVVVE
ncbi:MAG: C39 family peptidase [Patescibacteria group bacterium]|nr:C39 family peptidase [Patescibacteria group bacterium]